MNYSFPVFSLKSSIGRMLISRVFVALLLMVWAFPSFGASVKIAIDFQNLLTEEEKELLSPEDIISYLNTQDNEGIISAISYAELTYGYSKGLQAFGPYNNTYDKSHPGALFIQSTDRESSEDIGGITFKIAPKYHHKNTNLNIWGYKDSDNLDDYPTCIEVSINGGEFKTITNDQKDTSWQCRFNIRPENQVVNEIAIRVPNPNRDIKTGELLGDYYYNYTLPITHIDLYYSDTETPDKVTTWEFAEPTHSVYLADADSYLMPKLNAFPAEAAEYAELSSSDPNVAEIKDGKIMIKNSGTTTISAALADTPVFQADKSIKPASYDLIVDGSVSTAVDNISADNDSPVILYDLNGRAVTGTPVPGIYIELKGNSARKIVVR